MNHRFRAKSQGRYGKRHKPGEMNQTESLYAEELEAKRLTGEIVAWWFERYTFKLADDCRYTPDFAVLNLDGSMDFVDTKGAGPLDTAGTVKLRLAAEQFFQFRFRMFKRRRKKDGGGWEVREF